MPRGDAFSDRFDAATLSSQLATAVERWSEREAYVFEDGRLTFAGVADQADGVAAGLVALGIRRGDRVAVLMAGYHEWPAVYFGVTAIGAVLVPLNTRLTAHELGDLIVRSGARAVIYRADPTRGRDLQGRVRAAVGTIDPARRPQHIVVVGPDPGRGEMAFERLTEVGQRLGDLCAYAPDLASDAVAAVIYTSGSTGTPKGAMLNHQAMLRGAWYGGAILNASAEDRIFSPQPFFHAGGAVHMMLMPVVAGVTAVVQAYFHSARALELMDTERCTLALGHQPHWVDFLADPSLAARRLVLRAAYVIGDSHIRHAIHERLGLVTVSPYAMTETHLGGASATLADGIDVCLETNGRPYPGIELVIRDLATDEPVGRGEAGEICLGGWCPMSGYLDEPQLTAQAFDPDGAIRTGDIGRVDEHGYLHLVGRRKEMIRVGGENVSAGEVAAVLADHPAVKQAVAVAVEEPRLGEVVGAAIECHDGGSIELSELEAFCRDRLARYKVPRYVEIVAEWPMTGTGKIDRVAIQTRLNAGMQAPGDEPRAVTPSPRSSAPHRA